MAEEIDRNEFLRLCGRLGNSNDTDIAAAGRALTTILATAGRSWDEIVNLPTNDAEPADETADKPEELEEAAEDEAFLNEDAAEESEPAPSNSQALVTIDKLLARRELSGDLRAEIELYKSDIAAGTFDAADARYLKALARRLAKV